MLKFLVSPAAVDLCRSIDKLEGLSKRGNSLETYFSANFTPPEELLCAVILSRPINHS